MQPLQLQSLTILKSDKAQEYQAQDYKYWQSQCFWELIVTFRIVVPTMFSFSNSTYFGWTFCNTNSIQLAPSDIFAWYESFVLPEIEFKSEVLNHQLFTQLSLLVLFNFVTTKNILPLSKPRENMENLRGDLYLCQNAGRGVQFSGHSLRNRFEDRAYGACKQICS